MLIQNVKLNDYRNHSTLNINFDPNLNIIIGKNGVGKTNILESLILVSNTKSFRTLDDEDLIQKGKEYCKVECKTEDKKYKVVINQKGKTLFIDNTPIKKTSDFIGKVNCVLFKPSDLDLFNHSPKERRRLMDVEIGKVSKEYLNNLLIYNSLLKDKNKLYKEEKVDETYLSVINEQMEPCIKNIINKREQFIDSINININKYYEEISNNKSNIKIIYDKCCNVNEIKEKLKDSIEKDNYYHYATFGPHHEDYKFMMDEYELDTIASQGQTRMVLIAFKFALIEYIKEQTNKLPILLLDDILSELDVDNRQRLLNIIPDDTQVIITGTDIFGINFKKNFNLIEMEDINNG